MSVGFYSARGYQPLVKFAVVRTGAGSKTIILNNKHVYFMAEGLPKLRHAMCSGEPVSCSECKSGAFRLNVTKSRRMARLYSDSQYISLTLPDIDYLAFMFTVMQQQLRNYIVAMPDVLL